MRRSAALSAVYAVWSCIAIAVCFVMVLPLLLRTAWEDWRFHKLRCPKAGYTLLQAVGFSIRIWWQEVRG